MSLHSQAHTLISESFMRPPPLIMTDIRECCMTFAQSRHRKEEEEDGMGSKKDEDTLS